MSEEADVLVVGAGTAGAVVAARLAEDPKRRVVLVEAGGPYRGAALTLPLGYLTLLGTDRHNWNVEGDPEPGLDGRRLNVPRGRVVGGSSAINSMLYLRGHPADYDGWELPGWGWADVAPVFRRLERYERGGDTVRGGDGPVSVRHRRSDNPLHDAFVDACAAVGVPRTDDLNGRHPEGVGRLDHLQSVGFARRVSSATAYLAPARNRSNLRIVTDSQVARLDITDGHARGVVLTGDGGRTIGARHVVLAAGVIGTPHLLQLSGIGDPAHLRSLGLTVVADVAEVGCNLQDHIGCNIQHDCLEPVTMRRWQRQPARALAILQGLLFGRGPATHFPFDACALVRSEPGLERPDLQFYLGPMTLTRNVSERMDRHGFMISWCQLHPESRGTVRAVAPDPTTPPSVRTNALTQPADLAAHRRALRLARRIVAAAPFDRFRGDERVPGPAVAGDDDIDAMLRRLARTHYHPVGTARMGTDDRAVVDPSTLRVRGTGNVYVADASLMPELVGANTGGPALMIGERAAQLLAAAIRA